MTDMVPGVTTVVTRLQNSDRVEKNSVTSFLVKLLLSGAEFPGFWSGEILPPVLPGKSEWILVQRFRSFEQAQEWQQSEMRRAVLGEAPGVRHGQSDITFDGIVSGASPGTVATAIVTDVRPGKEAEYWSWVNKIQVAQAESPGYAGVYLQPASSDRGGKWTTISRFDSPEMLEKWFSSSRRREILAQGDELILSRVYQRLTSSFPGWFPVSELTGERPAKWKTAALVFLGLFPCITLMKRFFYPHTTEMNQTLATGLGTSITVFMVTWVTMPILVNCFGWWLLPKENSRKEIDVMGSVMVLCLLFVEMVLLWNTLNPRA